MNDKEASGLSLWIAIVVSVLILAILWVPELRGTPGLVSCVKGLPYDKSLATGQGFICGILLVLNLTQAWMFNLA
jgi:hypothetical protein